MTNLPLIRTLKNCTLEQTQRIAGIIAQLLVSGDVITLRGEVGAGKTTFARALIKTLAPQVSEVTSPTFNLMQSYDITLASGKRDIVWHLDLYRLEDAREAYALGLEELEKHLMLIEWPEIIEHTLLTSRLDISLGFGADPERRNIALHGNAAWRKRLALL